MTLGDMPNRTQTEPKINKYKELKIKFGINTPTQDKYKFAGNIAKLVNECWNNNAFGIDEKVEEDPKLDGLTT